MSLRRYACALLVRDGRMLLGKRAPHRKAYPLKWDVIGGLIEPGETVEAALRRELGEELGILPTAIEAAGEVPDGDAVYHMHLVRRWSGGEPKIANHEHTALAWLTPAAASALPDLALPSYVALFRAIGPSIDANTAG